MARLNPKRRAALKASKDAITRNGPSTQPLVGNVRSVWNDPAKVHRASEQRFKPDKPRYVRDLAGRVSEGRYVPPKGAERWSKN